jgi:hypothetical protein
MKKRTIPLQIVGCILVLLLSGPSFAFRSSSSQGETGQIKHNELPKGTWTLACLPAPKPAPVIDLYSVRTEAAEGLTVSRVEIRNQSDRHVGSVKLGWRLFLKDSPDTTLLKGETPFLEVSLSPRHRRSVKYPVVCFADVSKSLAKGSRLDGDFIMEVSVADIAFESESKRGQGDATRSYSVKPASFQHGEPCDTGDCTETGGCQNQSCTWNSASQCFKCINIPGFTCTVSNCGTCIESRCLSN